MEILVLMPLGEQRGGGELMLLDLLRQAEHSGITWRLVVFEEGPLVEQARALGIDTTVVTAGRLRHVHRYVQTVFTLARLARTADAVFSWMPKAQLYGAPAAVLARKPALWFQLAVPRRTAWLDVVTNLLPASGILTLSKEGQAAQARMWPHRRTRLVYPGVDLGRFDPAAAPGSRDARETLGLPPDVPIVGVVARLQRWKGIHLLIEALLSVAQAFPGTVAVIVGGSHALEPGYEPELHWIAEQLGVAEQVIFAGLRTDIPLWLSAMDVVVHPAADEPFGISVVEAMAMRKPVVASDSGGPLEIIEDGENGLLFRTGDAAQLAEAIMRLLADPERAALIGANASARAEAFSSARYASEVGDAVRFLTTR